MADIDGRVDYLLIDYGLIDYFPGQMPISTRAHLHVSRDVPPVPSAARDVPPTGRIERQ